MKCKGSACCARINKYVEVFFSEELVHFALGNPGKVVVRVSIWIHDKLRKSTIVVSVVEVSPYTLQVSIRSIFFLCDSEIS